MRNKSTIGIGIAAATLIAIVVYLVQSNDVTEVAAASETTMAPTKTPVIAPDVPPPQPVATRPNYSTGFTESPVSRSSNRKLLDGLGGAEFKRLVKSLRLNADHSEKLLDILADEMKRRREWLAANQRSFISQEEADNLRSESDQLAMELLGYDKFQQYDDYRKHPAERQQIDRINERLIDNAAEPLYPDIEDQLYAAIKEEGRRMPAPRVSSFGSHGEYQNALKKWRDDNRKRFLERAAGLLTPDQFSMLKD